MDGGVIDTTLAAILVGTGAFPAAAIVRQLIELLKVAIPELDRLISGARLAFILSLVLYVIAYLVVVGADASAESIFTAFLSWLACATSAVGINSTLAHYRDSRTPTE